MCDISGNASLSIWRFVATGPYLVEQVGERKLETRPFMALSNIPHVNSGAKYYF